MNVDLNRFNSIFDTLQENAILQTSLLSNLVKNTEENIELSLSGFASIEKAMNSIANSFKPVQKSLENIFNLNKSSSNDQEIEIINSIKEIISKSKSEQASNNEMISSLKEIISNTKNTETSSKEIILTAIQELIEKNQSSSNEMISSLQETISSSKSNETSSNEMISSLKEIISSSRREETSSEEMISSIQELIQNNENNSAKESLNSIKTVLKSLTLLSFKEYTSSDKHLSSVEETLNENSDIEEVERDTLNRIEKILESNKESTEKIYDILKETFEFDKENLEDLARAKRNEEVGNNKPKPGEKTTDQASLLEQLADKLFGDVKEVSGFDLFKVGLLAPLLFEFTKAFIGELTDGLFAELELLDVPQILSGLAFWKTLGPAFSTKLLKGLKKIYDVIIGSSVKLADIADDVAKFASGVGGKAIAGFNKIKPMFDSLTKIFGPILNFATSVTKFVAGSGGKILSAIGSASGITGLFRIIGKVFKPLGFIISAFEGIQAFAEKEGTLLEKIGAGIGQFFGSFVGSLLDFVKNIGAWVIEKLGFENAANYLREFSFEGLIRGVIEGIFGIVSDSIEWIKLLFTDPTAALTSLFQTALGGAKSILDIMYYPVDKAVQWISSIFGWEPGEDFSMTDLIWNSVSAAVDWIKTLFTDPTVALTDLWNGIVGEGGLISLLMKPIDATINWVMEKFGWKDEDAPEFSIYDTISGWIEDMKAWLKEIFSFIPSIDEVKTALLDAMPDWMRSLVGAPERTATEIVEREKTERQAEVEAAQDRIKRSEAGENVYYFGEEKGREEDRAIIAEQEAALKALDTTNIPPEKALDQRELERLKNERAAKLSAAKEAESTSGVYIEPNVSALDKQIADLETKIASYRMGTPGFIDFGKGTPVILHGEEAVVPAKTPAGVFLTTNFDENWQPKLGGIIPQTAQTTPNIEPNYIPLAKQNYVIDAGEETSIERQKAQSAIMNVMPQVVNSRPITNHNNSTTIINNVSPARSLDDPAMLK